MRSAIKGHGGMPARGGLADLTDAEIRSAVLYMFNPMDATASADEIEIALRKQQVEEPRPNTARQVAQDAFDALSPDVQQVVREHALEIIAGVESGDIDGAIRFVESEYKDHDEKMALWSQLPPNVRSAIKKATKESSNAV